ncbi:MAG: hypothetical protein ABWY78_04990 [Microvirga sp.]
MKRESYRDRLEALVNEAPEGLKVVAVVGDMIAEEVSVLCSCCSTCAEGLLDAGMHSVQDQIYDTEGDGLAFWQ